MYFVLFCFIIFMGTFFSLLFKPKYKRYELPGKKISETYSIVILCSHFLVEYKWFDTNLLQLLADVGLITNMQRENPNLINYSVSDRSLNCFKKIVAFQIQSIEKPNIDNLVDYLNKNFPSKDEKKIYFHHAISIHSSFHATKNADSRSFGYVIKQQNNSTFERYRNILMSLNPYFNLPNYRVDIFISDIKSYGSTQYFILKITGRNLRIHSAMKIFSLINNAFEEKMPVSQCISLIQQKKVMQSLSNINIKCFFYYESNYNTFSKIWKHGYLSKDKDITFHEYHPIITKYAEESLIPYCLDSTT